MSRARSLAAAAVLLLSSCGDDQARLDALAAMATDSAIPAYNALEGQAEVAYESITIACMSPSAETVTAARSEVQELRVVHASSEAFRQGPAMDERDQGRINTLADPEAIEELIIGLDPSVFDAHYVSTSIGATKRGLYALEYILFGDDSAEATAWALGEGNRCPYLVAVTGAILENVQNTAWGWVNSGEIKLAHVAILATPKYEQDNVNVTVETSIFLLRKITDMELAPALGLVGTEPDDAALAEGAAAIGLQVLHARLESVRTAMVADSGIGSLLSDDLGHRVSDELDQAQTQIAAIEASSGPSLRGAIASSPVEVTHLHDLIVTIERTLSTEVVSELGVVVGFSDADGDSAN